MTSIGRNVEAQVEGDTLILRVKLTEKGQLSKSGKSLVIGSTEGNQVVADGNGAQVVVGLNVYRKA